ncbi:MAG: ATP-binding protein [Polyangiaceae bacterium]|jgi:two-component system, cell cycle sensor histidine kinase and response regulator CckA
MATVADGLPVAICVFGAPSGTIAYANEAYRRIAGETPENELSSPHAIYTPDGEPYPEDSLPFARALREKKGVTIGDIVFHRGDGTKIFVRAYAQPSFNAGGAVTHVFVVLTDVTEAVETRSRADLAERRLLHILGHAPLILFGFDRHGVVTLSEGRGLQALGFGPRELVGRSVYELYANDPVSLANADRVLAGEEFTIDSNLGAIVLETTFTPVRDQAGAVDGAIGVSIDVTERVKMQHRLLQAERLASMGTLSATVAHEINNPFSYVLGNLELASNLLAEGDATPETRGRLAQQVDQAREGADRVRRIVRGLRAFSRQDDDRTEPTDVHVVLERALEMAGNVIRHRARLVRHFDAVPPVFANDLRLGQVFVNLLLNAAQAIPEGHADENEIRVSTWRHAAKQMVVIAVEDTGSGIPADVKTRIFEPFFTTKPVGVGTGLGLSICYGVVNGLGGTIEVDSGPGRGTTFRVYLPASGRALREGTVPPESPAPLRRGRVLIIDDDANVARTFALRLDGDHDVVVSLEPRAAAQRILAGERFDVIFCDLMMPDMTGMDFYAAITEKDARQAERIVFVTGGAFTPAAMAFVARVPNTFLEKPFDKASLDAVLTQYLGASAERGASQPG